MQLTLGYLLKHDGMGQRTSIFVPADVFCCDTEAEDGTKERTAWFTAKKKPDHEQEVFHHALYKSDVMKLYMVPHGKPTKLDSIAKYTEKETSRTPNTRATRKPMTHLGTVTKPAYTTAATKETSATKNGLIDDVLRLLIPPPESDESMSHPGPAIGNHAKKLRTKDRHEGKERDTRQEKSHLGEHNNQNRESHTMKTSSSMHKSLNSSIYR